MNIQLKNITSGMQWTVDQVNAVVQGGLWPKNVIFITWDDWGGWFDHVDPPNIEPWNSDIRIHDTKIRNFDIAVV